MSQHDDESILKIVFGIAAIPFLILLRAWVLTILWAWFVVPLGVGTIGIAHAYGLALAAQMFTGTSTKSKDEGLLYGIGLSVFGSLLFLAVGAIAHAFM